MRHPNHCLAVLARKCIEYPHRRAIYLRPLNDWARGAVVRMSLIYPQTEGCVAVRDACMLAYNDGYELQTLGITSAIDRPTRQPEIDWFQKGVTLARDVEHEAAK